MVTTLFTGFSRSVGDPPQKKGSDSAYLLFPFSSLSKIQSQTLETPSELRSSEKLKQTHFLHDYRRRYPCNVIRLRSSLGYLILSALLTRSCLTPLSTSSTLRVLVSVLCRGQLRSIPTGHVRGLLPMLCSGAACPRGGLTRGFCAKIILREAGHTASWIHDLNWREAV